MPHSRAHRSVTPRPDASFPDHLTEVMADLSCVLFRREMLPGGEIRYPYLSPNVRELFGFEAAEMTVTSKGALNAIHWADRDAHVAAILRSGLSMGRCLETFRAVTAAGETRWFRGSSAPVRLDDGCIVWDGAWLDISPWMRAEHQFQTVMDHAEDVILTLDANNGIDWANAAAERLFGWSMDELMGRSLAYLMAEPGKPEAAGACGMDEIMQSFPRGTQEITGRRKDGSTFPFELTVSEVRSDGRLSLIVIGRDITRRKATELMLEETERRLRSIAANLPGVVFQRVLDPDGTFAYSYVSEGIEEILGCEAADIVFDSSILFDAMVDADRARLLDGLTRSADTLEPVDEDVRVTGADGRMRWLAGQSRPRRRGDSIVWDGLILDVTDEVQERMKAEQAVRESEERFRQAFSAALQGVVITSLDGRIQQFNPAFQVICALTGEDLVGRNIREFVDSDLLPDENSPPALGSTIGFEFQPHLPDGHHRHWRVTGTAFAPNQGDTTQSLLLSIEDITERVRSAEERRQLEMALTEGQKLEALGRLAGGVAHELNNMLGPILMAAEMVTRTATLDTRNAERVERIIEAARHGRDIVRNVLAYCRKEQKSLAPLDVVPVFAQFSALATSILPPTVKVETHIGPDSAVVVGDAGQITQILLNLANNARDAMDGQGTLTLSLEVTGGDDLSPPRPRQSANGVGRTEMLANPFAKLDHTLCFADIRIADTGCGMSPETAAKIFDPFFTTKPVDQGTGLGLSVVQGIIKTMGGAIAVESAPGLGTVFRIVLPLADGSNAPTHIVGTG